MKSRDGWHEEQNCLMDSSHAATLTQADAADPAVRMQLFAAETVLELEHLAAVFALHRRSGKFRVLDLGCGEGRTARQLAARFPEASVVGIDDNQTSLDLAMATPTPPNLTFTRGRIEELPGSEVFDVVICSEVYEHVEAPDILLATIHRLLRSGGFLSLSTPSGWTARVPRLSVLREAIANPARARLRRHPHSNWLASLPLHPGTSWRILRRHLRTAGFDIVSRNSSLVWVEPASRSIAWFLQKALQAPRPERSLTYLIARMIGGGHSVRGAQKLFHIYMATEGLMNLLPFLRPLESRIVVLARKAEDGSRRQARNMTAGSD